MCVCGGGGGGKGGEDVCMYLWVYVCMCISRVSDQNGVSLIYTIFEIHHSDQEPSICMCMHFSYNGKV